MKTAPIDPKALALLRRIARREGVSPEALLRRAFDTPPAPREIPLRLQFSAGQYKALQRGAKAARVAVEDLAAFIAHEAVLGWDEAYIADGGSVLAGRKARSRRPRLTDDELTAEIRRQDEAAVAAGRAERRARGEIEIKVKPGTMKAIMKSAGVAGCRDDQLASFILDAMDRDIIAESGKVYREERPAQA